MTALLAPEFERYLTRRVTWIGAITSAVLVMIVTTMLALEPFSGPYRYQPSLASVGPGLIIIATIITGAWGFFTAASAIGSDQSSGALGTWLTFNPQRNRVYLAKLVAVLVPTVVYAFIATCGSTFLALLVSETPTPDALLAIMGMALRGTIVAGSFAILGFVLGLVGRSTLSALGVLVGWLVLVVLQAFFSSVTPGPKTWIGLEAVIGEFLMSGMYQSSDGLVFDYPMITMAGLGCGMAMAIVIAVGWVAFTRRDVH